MYKETTDFIGKDPMQWWIGQVTDPKKGKWDNLLEKKNAENGEPIYSHRCRVRIVGYHGCGDELPDDQLPLAHVLLPPNMSTTGGLGSSMKYHGGEVVVGFFLDGEDAQQPIIFGTLFKQSFIKDGIKNSQFNAKKQTCFVPYTPPDVRATAGDQQRSVTGSGGNGANGGGSGAEDSEWSGNFPNASDKTVAEENVNANTEFEMDSSTACEDNEISKISNEMKEFSRKMKVFQKLNSSDVFVNPLYGGLVDMQAELKLTSNRIQNSVTKLVRRGRSYVIGETLDKLSTTFKDKVPKPLQGVAGEATNALSNTIYCNFEKIQDQLGDYLMKSLENMLGQLLDVPICGVENFLGDMFGQINNILDTSLGSIFDQLNSIQGGGIALPSKTFSNAIKFADIITGVLDCDQMNCPENTSYSSKNGIRKALPDDFSNLIPKIGVSSFVNPLLDAIDGAIPQLPGLPSLDGAVPAVPSAPNCSTNVLRCGPPRVDFLGPLPLGGQGATGEPIINVLGQVIGVAITGSGFGYTEPPLLSFFDSCENGYGAGGFVKLGEVTDPNGNSSTGVVEVVITSPGQNYLPNTTETDLDGNVKEVIPSPDGNYDGSVSYVSSIADVVLTNTGFGYQDGDTVAVEGGTVSDTVAVEGGTVSDTLGDEVSQGIGQAEVELIIEEGLVAGANVINGGFGFTSIPDLVINSDTGSGARLTPVLRFTKIEDATELAQISQDAVVTVISCIEK